MPRGSKNTLSVYAKTHGGDINLKFVKVECLKFISYKKGKDFQQEKEFN